MKGWDTHGDEDPCLEKGWNDMSILVTVLHCVDKYLERGSYKA